MSISYKDAGVDKNKGYEEVRLIKKFIHETKREEVLSDLGGFSGMFKLKKYNNPVLVSGTDGVGTKLKLAFDLDVHNTIGIDAVAMCVNDILCQGAEPLFFLDYIACSELIPEKMASIVEGVSNGCNEANCSLIGGETAEMPGFYKEGEYDIAGFCVGVVEEDKIISSKKIKKGDILIAITSSGVHSNGFSLVRKILEINNIDLNTKLYDTDKTIGEVLLTPTRIYKNAVLTSLEKFDIHGISHITGGGFYENIPRMFDENEFSAVLTVKDIPKNLIFDFLQEKGNIELKEMYGTFNMGIGMVFAVDSSQSEDFINHLKSIGEIPVILGEITEKKEESCIIKDL